MIGGMSVAAKTERDSASCYETPQWLVERIRTAFGGTIDLDPCTTLKNPVGATRFYAPPDDGIALPWHSERIYVNPPYGRTIRHWAQKAIQEAWACQVILLVPARTDARWFQELAREANRVIFIAGRIQFVTGGAPGNAPFPSALVGLNHDLAALADLGWYCRRAAREAEA